MPERERLERPQASLLEDIEAEMAEEARLASMDNTKLLMWKKRHAKVTISILYVYIIGFAVILLVAPFSQLLAGIVFALGFLSVIILSIRSLWIGFTHPDIFKIKMDGSFHLSRTYFFNFLLLWYEIGFPAVAIFILVIALLLTGTFSLF